jgi:hypothetical protein
MEWSETITIEDTNQILKDIRALLKDNIIPRLTDLEIEVRSLRKVTWPVCQSQLETNGPFQCLQEKKKFFSNLYEDEVYELLRLKARIKGQVDQVLLDQEFNSVKQA